ncbi:MAG: hypothetical protein JNM17_15055 [Archangium sp.]|nr:hypothetical protein [Archangium sp.]
MKRALVLCGLMSACATTQATEKKPVEPTAKAPPATAPECPKEPGKAVAPGGSGELSTVLGAKVEKVCLIGASENAYLRLHEVVAPREGTTLDAPAVRADLEGLFGQGMVRDAQAIAIPFGDGKRVVLAYFVTEYPFISKVRFEGLNGVRADELRDSAPSGARASGMELKKISNAVTEEFIERGYMNATVDVSTASIEGGTVEAVIKVSEGVRTVVQKIRFVGNKRVSEKDLVVAIKTQLGAPFRQDVADLDAMYLSNVYFDRGMVNVRVEPEAISPVKPEQLELVFKVTEGDVFKLGKLSLTGFSLGNDKELMKALESKPGAVFSRSALQRDMERLKDKANKKGLRVNVTPITNVDSDKKLVDIALELEKQAGPIQF